MSAEYIKREDAIKAVEARGVERQYGYGRTDYDQGRNDEISYISDVVLPEVPAADVAHVVRCGQCRYRFNCAPADSEFGGFGPDDFCSRGVADLEVETDAAD